MWYRCGVTMFWANALKPFVMFVLLLIAGLIARPLFYLLPDGRLRRRLYKPIRDDDFAYVRALKRFDDALIGALVRLFVRSGRGREVSGQPLERLPPPAAKTPD